MEELNNHFDTVQNIAVSELDGSNGSQTLCENLAPPFDTLKQSQIETWIERLSNSLSRKCWRTSDFKSSCTTHGTHLLYVAETGDVPEIVKIGYPMMEVPHAFENIGLLTEATIMLPQLVANISDASFDDEPYFECTDLFHCYLDDFGLTTPEIEEIENMDASRLLVDSIAILSMINSWQNVAPAPGANVYFCVSSGSYAFGRPILIQHNAR